MIRSSERFCAAVLAQEPAALQALASLRLLPPAQALALLTYLTEGLEGELPKAAA